MKDPVCGMEVSKRDIVGLKKGKKYYFCSEECRRKFLGLVPFYKTEGFGRRFVSVLFVLMVLGITLSIYFDRMLVYMGVFFILFSFMKLLDLNGFKLVFSKYDIVAKRISLYGYFYPFIEMILGVSFLSGYFVYEALIVTVVITFVSSIGVVLNMFSEEKVQCACLGTKINLPLTKVTLFENVSMFVMALVLLLFSK